MPFIAEEVIADANASLTKRRQWEGLWKESLFYTQPGLNILPQSQGTKLPPDLYDSTGIYSANIASAGICGYLTNPSSRWFNYEMSDPQDMEDNEVKQYCADCDNVVYGLLSNSNFYQKIQQLDRNLVTIGAPVFYCEEDPKDIVRFFTIGHLDCAIAEDDTERVDTVYRWREYTARQAYKKWGKKAGPKALELIQAKKYEEKIVYLHAVTPRHVRDVAKTDNKNMPWASIWISIPDIKIIDEKGYPEFPFFVPRWDKAEGSPYAYCPASHALADMKTLNDMDGTILQAGKLAVKPPLVIPHDGYVLPITQKAGGLNYKLSGPNGDKIETLSTGGNIGIGLDMTEQRRRRVEQAFFVDLFRQFQNDPNMTATEVNIKNNQNMLLLGPSIGNTLTDCISPCLFRVYMIAGRAGLLPQIPEKIAKKTFTIKYTSQLARAQKMAQLNGLTNTINSVTAILQLNPEAGDVIDFDEAVREISEINGNNPKLTRDDKAVDKVRADRQQQIQQQQQMQAMLQAAQIAKTGADAGASIHKTQQPIGAGK